MAIASMCNAQSSPSGWRFQIRPTTGRIGESRNERPERVFLVHAYRWLKAGGVLVLVVPAQHVCDCGEILASRFKDTRIFRLTDPEAVRAWQQPVVQTPASARRDAGGIRIGRDRHIAVIASAIQIWGANGKRYATTRG